MQVDLEKVLKVIRRKANENELESYRRKEENSELSHAFMMVCFELELLASHLETTSEIL